MNDPITDHPLLPEELARDVYRSRQESGEGNPRPPRTWLFGSVLFLTVFVGGAAIVTYASVQSLLDLQTRLQTSWEGVEQVHHRQLDLARELKGDLLRRRITWRSLELLEAAQTLADDAPSLAAEVIALPAVDRALARVQEDLQTRMDAGPEADGLLRDLEGLGLLKSEAVVAFNGAARRWDTLLGRIPTNWVGRLMDFERVPLYEEAG